GGNLARFINHACRPNCYSHILGKTIWIRAARNIEPGEELTYNYYTDGEKQIPCRCRPVCKTKRGPGETKDTKTIEKHEGREGHEGEDRKDSFSLRVLRHL